MVKKVCLVWATSKRHIAVDSSILCKANSKSGGYAVSNGSYNSLSLRGLPDYDKSGDDKKYTHSDGIIEFMPLDKQKWFIDTKSVCQKCLKKYNSIIIEVL